MLDFIGFDNYRIFDKETITDNRKNTVKAETDIHGNYQFEEIYNGEKTKIFQDFRGNWNYERGNRKATLEKIFNQNYIYKDSDNECRHFEHEVLSGYHYSHCNLISHP